MVVSMLLAGPAFAGTQAADDATIHARKAPSPMVAHKKPTPARTASSARTPQPREAERGRGEARTTFVEDTSVWSDSPTAGRSRSGWKQTGVASWYGGARWHGHMTASGARYNENELTAAHAWLPIGTRVVVALNDSGRSVVVTINDRPGTHSRVIDLSREAARQLGIMSRGVAMVTLSPL
jgi:rare lipoprotein A (peptidoglycan hydrolase)